MTPLRRVVEAFSVPPSSKKISNTFESRDVITRAVTLAASGNYNLQRGKYCTQDSVDLRRGRVCAHVFFEKRPL